MDTYVRLTKNSHSYDLTRSKTVFVDNVILALGEFKCCRESVDSGRNHFYNENVERCNAMKVCNIVLYIVCCLLTIFVFAISCLLSIFELGCQSAMKILSLRIFRNFQTFQRISRTIHFL